MLQQCHLVLWGGPPTTRCVGAGKPFAGSQSLMLPHPVRRRFLDRIRELPVAQVLELRTFHGRVVGGQGALFNGFKRLFLSLDIDGAAVTWLPFRYGARGVNSNSLSTL
jgi:hypothetical protein